MTLKRIVPLLIFLLFLGNWANYAQERYSDLLFSEVRKNTVTYADTLSLDFYSAVRDTLTQRPLLLLVHGGGFATGKRDNPLEQKFSEDMAKRGFAVASISYRLTRMGKSFGCYCPAEEKIETFLAASEDVLRAVRYLADHVTDLRFDEDKIVLIGSSAGAEAVLNTVFLNAYRDFRRLPYGDVKFAGVISFAGAVLNADYITSKNAVPTLLFHGEKDNLVPYASNAHHRCKESDPGFLLLDGPETIAHRLEALGVSYTLVHDPEGNHDWANLPYSRTEFISEFIRKSILNGDRYQTRIKVSAKD